MVGGSAYHRSSRPPSPWQPSLIFSVLLGICWLACGLDPNATDLPRKEISTLFPPLYTDGEAPTTASFESEDPEVIQYQLRLIGGSVNNEGLLQVFIDGQWGWVYGYHASYRSNLATVACWNMGYEKAVNTVVAVDASAGLPDFTPWWVARVRCSGYERRLVDCGHLSPTTLRNTTDEDWKIPIALKCTGEGSFQLNNVTTPPLGSEVRLTDDNFVQVMSDGIWQYITSMWPESGDAITICRQLGGQNVAAAWTVSSSELRKTREPVLPFVFQCSIYQEPGSLVGCFHQDLLKASLSSAQKPELLHLECTEEPTPDRGALRLVDGPSPSKGRLEIYVDYRWGTICDDMWVRTSGSTNAKVVCRQLGLGEVGFSQSLAYYGRGDAPIVLDDVQCGGAEERLLDCPHRDLGQHNCEHQEDVGVECYPSSNSNDLTEEWKVELVGGPAPQAGTIQIQIDGEIGTICDDNFDLSDAQVVCRMLGYPYAAGVHHNAYFGHGQGEILLDDLECTGTERSLQDCEQNGLGIHNCGHREDAGVTCSYDFFNSPSRTERPLFIFPTNGSPADFNMGIGSATILIAVLVVMCLGCMFCACVMRRLRVNSNPDGVNNNPARQLSVHTYALVDQRERAVAAGETVIPPSYTDVVRNPAEYAPVHEDEADGLPPQSPSPTSPPPTYANAFPLPNNTMRVITEPDPSSGGARQVRRETIPIPVSPPPSYNDAAPVYPARTPDTSRSAQALPDVVTVIHEQQGENHSASSDAESSRITSGADNDGSNMDIESSGLPTASENDRQNSVAENDGQDTVSENSLHNSDQVREQAS